MDNDNQNKLKKSFLKEIGYIFTIDSDSKDMENPTYLAYHSLGDTAFSFKDEESAIQWSWEDAARQSWQCDDFSLEEWDELSFDQQKEEIQNAFEHGTESDPYLDEYHARIEWEKERSLWDYTVKYYISDDTEKVRHLESFLKDSALFESYSKYVDEAFMSKVWCNLQAEDEKWNDKSKINYIESFLSNQKLYPKFNTYMEETFLIKNSYSY